MDVSKVNLNQWGALKHPEQSDDKPLKAGRESKRDQSQFVRYGSTLAFDGYTREAAAVSESKPKSKPLTVAELRESIKQEVWDQTFQLLKDMIPKTVDTSLFDRGIEEMVEFSGDKNDPLKLIAHFTANPEDWEKVMRGDVPDYFNVENTGQRILDIWIQSFDDSSDIETWLSETKEKINAIYDEVAGMVGGLPQLVQDTRDFVMNALDKFAGSKLSNTE